VSELQPDGVDDLPAFPDDRFEGVQQIGVGRNATVFGAFDRSLDRRVALKVAAQEGMLSPEGRQRLAEFGIEEGFVALLNKTLGPDSRYTLLREARLLARVDHPNVIPVLDVGRLADGGVAVVMPWMHGGVLADRDFGGRWQDVLEVALQIGEGLAAIHEAGFLHRDFKPNNVLFDDDGRPRIADLGLACRLDDAEAMAEFVGTGQYMSPEALRQTSRDQRDDLYAYCMVVFEMFYGHGPFASAEARMCGKVSDIRRRGGMSARLRRVLIRGLHPDPEQRWPDMRTLLAAMRRTKRARTWVAGSVVAGISMAVAICVFASMRTAEADVCEVVDDELAQIWNDEIESQLRDNLGTRIAGDNLVAWASRWASVRARECDAARRAERETTPTPCSASLRERFVATVRALSLPHVREGWSHAPVIAELPAPEHCLDHPNDTEPGYGRLLGLRDIEAEVSALVLMDELDLARARQADYMELARAQPSAYGAARALFWRGEIERLVGDLGAARQDFEAVYADSQALDAPLLGAEAMLKLTAIAGALGKFEAVEAHALSALSVFARYEPDRVAELLQVHGSALMSGPEMERSRGLALLIRATELRADQVRRHGGTRERRSQAHESYARALLVVGQASEALEHLDQALRDHQEEFGHRTWRTREILRLKFSALLELRRVDEAVQVQPAILRLDVENEDWRLYCEDAWWLAEAYERAGLRPRAVAMLRYGRARAVKHGLFDHLARFDHGLGQLSSG
jgi:tRNA A-37 threonylcarbamoyl transferase component Bud32/tetratricopeptide (TPR) repeat protein